MKRIDLILLSILAIGHPTVVTAVTLVNNPTGSAEAANTSSNQFGLSGTITRYQPSQSAITISGYKYTLSGMGSLKGSDLKPGLKVKYNVEKSASEKRGRVTRIWIESEDK
jgi:hypothetical protein